MNCDQVFDVLTAGPFPSGSRDDVAVERHLQCCHECRQFAEAMRPAARLLQDQAAAALPRYEGSQPRPAAELTRSVQRAVDRHRGLPYVYFQRLAAAALIVLALWLARGWAATDNLTAERGPAPAPTAGKDNGMLLASLDLPLACAMAAAPAIDPAGLQLVSHSQKLRCCTECHAAANPSRPSVDTVAMANIQRSCRTCH